MIKKIFFILVISFCLAPFSTIAEDFVGPTQPTTFTLIKSLPSADGDLKDDVTLEEYVQWAFTFILTIAAFLAVLMITVGGITYMASGGNESMVTKGRGYITNALYGLLLAFGAYLLLHTINPKLVSFDFLESLDEFEASSGNDDDSGSNDDSLPTDGSTYFNDACECYVARTVEEGWTEVGGREYTKTTETYTDDDDVTHTTEVKTYEDEDGDYTFETTETKTWKGEGATGSTFTETETTNEDGYTTTIKTEEYFGEGEKTWIMDDEGNWVENELYSDYDGG